MHVNLCDMPTTGILLHGKFIMNMHTRRYSLQYLVPSNLHRVQLTNFIYVLKHRLLRHRLFESNINENS